MAFQKKKDVWIGDDVKSGISTSRQMQWGILGSIVGLILLLIGFFLYSHQRQQAQETLAARPTPQQVTFQSADDLRFFEPKTGQSLIWYTKNASGYVLYDADGYDANGTQLKAVTQGDVDDIKRWAGEIVQKRQDEQRAAYIAALQSLFRFSGIPDGTKIFALGINARELPQSEEEACAGELSDQLSTLLPTQSIKSDMLSDDFFTKGYFEKAFAGDSAFLNDAGVFNHAGFLFLIKPSATFKPSSVDGVISCHLAISCRIYASGTKETRQARFEATGPGFSEEASFKRAMEVIFETNRDKINQLIAGTP
jgi:hypothetical protein